MFVDMREMSEGKVKEIHIFFGEAFVKFLQINRRILVVIRGRFFTVFGIYNHFSPKVICILRYFFEFLKVGETVFNVIDLKRITD